jgi:putative FmdB family regulatory protein
MPTYEYRCTDCGERFTRLESIQQHDRQRPAPACPKCRSPDVERVLTPVFVKTIRKS